jgi:hypothetical protein
MDIYRQTSACLDYRKYFRSWVLVSLNTEDLQTEISTIALQIAYTKQAHQNLKNVMIHSR